MLSRVKLHIDVLRRHGVKEYLRRLLEMHTYRVLFIVNPVRQKSRHTRFVDDDSRKQS